MRSKGNQPWIFTGRTNAEAEAPILWPRDAKSGLIGKHPDAGKHWRQEEKGTTEDEMVGWHHWLNGHVFEQTRGDSDGPRSLLCCSSWGHKESYKTATEQHLAETSWHLLLSPQQETIHWQLCITPPTKEWQGQKLDNLKVQNSINSQNRQEHFPSFTDSWSFISVVVYPAVVTGNWLLEVWDTSQVGLALP